MSNLLSDSGIYATYMSSFFGNLDPSQQQSLWTQYLGVNGLTTNPPQDTQDEQNFVQYLQGLYTQQNLNPALSPDATTQRSVITATFDAVLQMLTTLTNTVAEQANNLIFLGNYQNAYTQMLTNVPILTGGQNDTWTLPNDSSNPADVQNLTSTSQLSSFTLGYNNISIQDIAQYMANINPTTSPTTGATPAPSSTQFVVWSSPLPNNQQIVTNDGGLATQVGLVFQYVPATSSSNSNNNLQDFNLIVSVVTNSPSNSDGQTQTPSGSGFTSYQLPYVIQNVDDISSSNPTDLAGQTFSQKVTSIENAFLSAWNDTEANKVLTEFAQAGATPNIPWQADANISAASTTSGTQQIQQSTQLQGQINTQDQEYIENARSYRTTIQNTAQAMQSNLSQTQQAISQQSSLLTSMINTLNTLISAIFTPH